MVGEFNFGELLITANAPPKVMTFWRVKIWRVRPICQIRQHYLPPVLPAIRYTLVLSTSRTFPLLCSSITDLLSMSICTFL